MSEGFTAKELDTIIMLCARVFETAAFSNLAWEFLTRVEQVQDTAHRLRDHIAFEQAREAVLAQS